MSITPRLSTPDSRNGSRTRGSCAWRCIPRGSPRRREWPHRWSTLSPAASIGRDPLLERGELQLPGAPAGLGGRQEVVVFAQPEIEVPLRVEPQDGFSEEALQPPEELVDLRQLLAGVGEEILDVELGDGCRTNTASAALSLPPGYSENVPLSHAVLLCRVVCRQLQASLGQGGQQNVGLQSLRLQAGGELVGKAFDRRRCAVPKDRTGGRSSWPRPAPMTTANASLVGFRAAHGHQGLGLAEPQGTSLAISRRAESKSRSVQSRGGLLAAKLNEAFDARELPSCLARWVAKASCRRSPVMPASSFRSRRAGAPMVPGSASRASSIARLDPAQHRLVGSRELRIGPRRASTYSAASAAPSRRQIDEQNLVRVAGLGKRVAHRRALGPSVAVRLRPCGKVEDQGHQARRLPTDRSRPNSRRLDARS